MDLHRPTDIAEYTKQLRIEDYTYDLPPERIAKYPLTSRDESKLLVYRHGEIAQHRFDLLPELLPTQSTLIFNNTRVVRARLLFHKTSGALIEIMCLEPLEPADYALSFSSIGSCRWKCMVGNLKKWKGEVLRLTLSRAGHEVVLRARELARVEGHVEIEFCWSPEGMTFSEVLELSGRIPIPPYLQRESEDIDTERYQTVYSCFEGSVAAPTAGLHFTPEVLNNLTIKNISQKNITLHVGAGTFRPVKAQHIGNHDMHTEAFTIDRGLVETLQQASGPVGAVGTTSLRALESLFWAGVALTRGMSDAEALHIGQWVPYESGQVPSGKEALEALLGCMQRKKTDSLEAKTSILIVPGYNFRFADFLVTNFHQPSSTLLLLVAAFIGPEWKKVYQYALDNAFRFLSYGDSSLLFRKE